MTKTPSTHKFLQSIDDDYYYVLRQMAKARDVTVQELVRAVIIPDWIKKTVEKNSGQQVEQPVAFTARSATLYDLAS